jgi:hypothetical protein
MPLWKRTGVKTHLTASLLAKPTPLKYQFWRRPFRKQQTGGTSARFFRLHPLVVLVCVVVV